LLKLEHVTGNNTRETEQLLWSIQRLKSNSDFQTLVEALRQAQSQIDQKNRTATEPTLHWGQGAAQFVSSLLETIDKADETFKAIQKQPRKT